MKLKINTKAFPIFLLICLVFFAWHEFFLVYNFSESVDLLLKSDNIILIISVASLIFLSTVLILKKKFVSTYSKYLKYIMSLICAIFFVMMYSFVKYPRQSLFTVFKEASVWLVPIFSLIVIFYLERGGSIQSLLECMNFFAVMWYILLIVQVFWYNQTGSFLLNFQEYFLQHYNEGDYGIRVNMHVFGNAMIIYNAICLKYDKYIKMKIWHLSALIMGIYCLMVIQQTRALIFYLVVVVAISFFVFSDKGIKTRIIQLTIVLVAGYTLCFTDIVGSFFDSFSINGEKAISTSARLYALKYYMECFFDNAIFGNGFADGAKGSVYSVIEHGTSGLAYYGDMGIIGAMANIGLMTIITFIIPIIRMIKVWKNKMKYYDEKVKAVLLSFIIFFIVSSPTYFVMSGRNVLLFAIVFGIFEYINVSINRKENI